MKFFIDLSKKQLIKSAASNVALERLVLKRRDSLAVEVVFVSRNAVAAMPAGTTVSVALKKTFADSNFLASASGTPPVLNLNTVPLEAAFSTNPSAVTALLEIRWTVPGETTRTATLTAEVQNSVILGSEGSPEAVPDLKATQAEAQAGTNNEKWMTPLRTAQAIAVLAPPPTWDAVLNKPATFPPSAHTHAISEVTGLQTALTAEETARIAGDQSLAGGLNEVITALAGKQPIGDYLDPALAANTYQKRDILLHQELTGFFAAPLGSHSVRTRYNVAVTGNGTNAVFILPKLPEGEDSTRYFNLRWEIYVAALPDTATLTFRRYRWDTASQQYFNPNQLVDIPVGPVRVGDTFTFILGNSNDPFSTTQDGVWHMVGRTFGLRANYAPHSPTANGLPGDLTFSDPYLYVCVNTNQWRRVPLSTW